MTGSGQPCSLFLCTGTRSLTVTLTCAFSFFHRSVTRFLLFAFATLLRQLFLLLAQLLGLLPSFFLEASEFDRVDSRGSRRLGNDVLVTLNERAFLSHFHLDRAGTPCGVSLLDFGRGLFGQCDFLALGRGSAMAGLQETQQLVFVGL